MPLTYPTDFNSFKEQLQNITQHCNELNEAAANAQKSAWLFNYDFDKNPEIESISKSGLQLIAHIGDNCTSINNKAKNIKTYIGVCSFVMYLINDHYNEADLLNFTSQTSGANKTALFKAVQSVVGSDEPLTQEEIENTIIPAVNHLSLGLYGYTEDQSQYEQLKNKLNDFANLLNTKLNNESQSSCIVM